MPPDPALRHLVKRALQREALRNLADGQRLHHGQWLPANTRPPRRLFQSGWALALWALTALVGLGLLALVTLIL